MLVELGDVVKLSRDLANLQLGVDVVKPLGEASLGLAGERRSAGEGPSHRSVWMTINDLTIQKMKVFFLFHKINILFFNFYSDHFSYLCISEMWNE